MESTDRLPLKAFWEAVEARLAECSAEELRAILRAMAQSTAPNARRAFLDQLGATGAPASPLHAPEDLLDEIQDLRQELAAEMENPPEPDYGDSWYDSDEDLSDPYADFRDQFVGLFDQAQAAFEYGDFELAADAYQELFDVLSLEDDYGRGLDLSTLPGVVADEAVARYLRACYEITPSAERPTRMYAELGRHRLLGHARFMLQDVIQITPHPLPDRERFLNEWTAFLRELNPPSGSNADVWLREVTRMAQGTVGLAALARVEGVRRPRAYLDWLTALEAEGKVEEALSAAQEALAALPVDMPIRAHVADHLCTAAAALERSDLVREGRWAAFVAKPTLLRLLDVRDAAVDDADLTRLMERALSHMQAYRLRPHGSNAHIWPLGDDGLERAVDIDGDELAHAYLLSGEWEAARALASRGQVLGWSGAESHQGLVIGAFLVLLAHVSPSELPPNLKHVWNWGLDHTLSSGSIDSEIRSRLVAHYARTFEAAQASARQQATLLVWCLDTARKRVDAIVGNQHRGSYGKAAVLTVACGEVLRLRDDLPAARLFISNVREAFPRHNAFQRELRSALAAGPGFNLAS